jgi:ubiquinone biosynthesis protein COQ9
MNFNTVRYPPNVPKRRVIVAINISGLLFRYQERSQTNYDIQSETRTETTMNIKNSRNENIKKDHK